MFYSMSISETLEKAIISSHGTHLSFISDTATIPPHSLNFYISCTVLYQVASKAQDQKQQTYFDNKISNI